jgi:DNA polymerase-3 subunit alpha
VDFPITKRKFVIDYLREKYGKDRVCQMATFGRLQGRGAIKEVLRVNNVCDFEQMNKITKDIPQEAEINDQMEESSETSILRWTLQNDPKALADWCKVDEDGVLTGEYAEFFAQAIRLEGTYKSQGKHAAGVLIAAEPLDKICPMINDKNSDEKIAGMGMSDLESMGHTKLDILGVAALDKLSAVNNLLQTGKVESYE